MSLTELERENEELRDEVSSLETEIEHLEDKVKKLEEKIEELEDSLDYSVMEALEAQLEDSEKLIAIAKDFFDNHAMAFENQKLVYLKLDFMQQLTHYEIQHNFIVQ